MSGVASLQRQQNLGMDTTEQDIGRIVFKKRDNLKRWLEYMRQKYPDDKERKYIMFEVATEYLFQNNLLQTVDQLKKDEVGWGHLSFESINQDFQEQDDFLETPPQVEEGVLECKRCHSKRTFSFSKQTRRSDESATVFIRCSNCDYMYRM